MRYRGQLVAGVVVAFLGAVEGWGQGAPARVQFNTAGAGAQAVDIEAAVGVICPAGQIVRGKDGKVSGCKVCPKGTDFYGFANSQWEMYAKTPGHFTSAKDENLLLSGTECDSHANNFGGTFVFALEAGKARLVRYAKGVITDQCLKFAYADGRDGLVCRGGWSGQGEADASVQVDSFGATGSAVSKTLINARDTTGECGGDVTQVVQEAEIKDFQLEKNSGGGISGLKITATLGSVTCTQRETEVKTGKTAAGVKSYTLEFVFDGKQFTATAGSRAALGRFATD
jgi:hypothetical protein